MTETKVLLHWPSTYTLRDLWLLVIKYAQQIDCIPHASIPR